MFGANNWLTANWLTANWLRTDGNISLSSISVDIELNFLA